MDGRSSGSSQPLEEEMDWQWRACCAYRQGIGLLGNVEGGGNGVL